MIDQDKPRINWDRIGPRTAVWCATEEEASEFVRAAHERGCHWAGSAPDGCLCRGAGRDTVYYIRDGRLMWSSRSAATSYVDAVVNFSDLLEAASGEVQDGRPRILRVEEFESICEAVHNGWWDEKKRQGVTDHPDMIPYDELAEGVKEYDRISVRRVLDALGIRYESKPRFSEEEVAAASMFAKAYPGGKLEREDGGNLYLQFAGSRYQIPNLLFLSLHLGQSIALKEIIG